MARTALLNEYPKVLKLNESFIGVLADSAKKEIEKGINNKILIDIYKRTYGKNIARKVFKLMGL